jgi:hypothetical protein
VSGAESKGQVNAMTVQTVKLGGKTFVIVPEKDFRRLEEQAGQQRQQDRGDVAESRRRMKEPGGKRLAEVRKRLGV